MVCSVRTAERAVSSCWPPMVRNALRAWVPSSSVSRLRLGTSRSSTWRSRPGPRAPDRSGVAVERGHAASGVALACDIARRKDLVQQELVTGGEPHLQGAQVFAQAHPTGGAEDRHDVGPL